MPKIVPFYWIYKLDGDEFFISYAESSEVKLLKAHKEVLKLARLAR